MGWRNDGTGRFEEANPPREWSPEQNIVWKAELPGHSLASPIVAKGRVFVTSHPAELLCFDAGSGKLLWQRSHTYSDVFGPEKGARIEKDLEQARQIRQQRDELNRERDEAKKAGEEERVDRLTAQIDKLQDEFDALTTYPFVPGGEPGNVGCTPTSDGEHVFTAYGTGVVSSHTLEGKRNWMKFIEAPEREPSASPLLADGKLIVHLRDLAALDPETGEALWKAETPSRHGSPVAAELDGTPVVVTPAGAIVQLSDGELLLRDQFVLGYSSPLVHDGVVYAMQEGKLTALRLTAPSGEKERLPVVWEVQGSRTHRLASPVYHDGLIYGVTEQGILEVTDATTGERVYRQRLDFGGGRADPSVSVAGNLIYVSNNRGVTFVLRPGRIYQELARNNLEEFKSSLYFAGSRMYVRTRGFLWCIAEQTR